MGQSEGLGKMKFLLVILLVVLASCNPVPADKELDTKYPAAPTMQSAEDAMEGQLFKD